MHRGCRGPPAEAGNGQVTDDIATLQSELRLAESSNQAECRVFGRREVEVRRHLEEAAEVRGRLEAVVGVGFRSCSLDRLCSSEADAAASAAKVASAKRDKLSEELAEVTAASSAAKARLASTAKTRRDGVAQASWGPAAASACASELLAATNLTSAPQWLFGLPKSAAIDVLSAVLAAPRERALPSSCSEELRDLLVAEGVGQADDPLPAWAGVLSGLEDELVYRAESEEETCKKLAGVKRVGRVMCVGADVQRSAELADLHRDLGAQKDALCQVDDYRPEEVVRSPSPPPSGASLVPVSKLEDLVARLTREMWHLRSEQRRRNSSISLAESSLNTTQVVPHGANTLALGVEADLLRTAIAEQEAAISASQRVLDEGGRSCLPAYAKRPSFNPPDREEVVDTSRRSNSFGALRNSGEPSVDVDSSDSGVCQFAGVGLAGRASSSGAASASVLGNASSGFGGGSHQLGVGRAATPSRPGAVADTMFSRQSGQAALRTHVASFNQDGVLL
eukprot:TRINITY_DN42728_c0_g1_i1.p1 TRINITY_DN42728_c0_g1~~TRINITY_DN42728_c0_g1_i1.p1  ORF type:complete len:509 (-),score=109.21 TRINITY_DN42728_c0_g1_i1:33-1559(-)